MVTLAFRKKKNKTNKKKKNNNNQLTQLEKSACPKTILVSFEKSHNPCVMLCLYYDYNSTVQPVHTSCVLMDLAQNINMSALKLIQ